MNHTNTNRIGIKFELILVAVVFSWSDNVHHCPCSIKYNAISFYALPTKFVAPTYTIQLKFPHTKCIASPCYTPICIGEILSTIFVFISVQRMNAKTEGLTFIFRERVIDVMVKHANIYWLWCNMQGSNGISEHQHFLRFPIGSLRSI